MSAIDTVIHHRMNMFDKLISSFNNYTLSDGSAAGDKTPDFLRQNERQINGTGAKNQYLAMKS